MELRTAKSPFFSVGSGCGSTVLRGCRYHSVSGLLSYGVRSTPAPRAPCHASEWKGAAHPVLLCVLFSQADQRCR